MEIKEEMQLKLKRIQSEIKNCEWDLKYNFKDSPVVQNKLLKLNERKIQTEKQIKEQ